jgi:hypothetical protein
VCYVVAVRSVVCYVVVMSRRGARHCDKGRGGYLSTNYELPAGRIRPVSSVFWVVYRPEYMVAGMFVEQLHLRSGAAHRKRESYSLSLRFACLKRVVV